MRPVSASRAKNLITYFPGSSVNPVSYWIGRRYGSANEPRNAVVDEAIARGEDTVELTYEVPDHAVEAADKLAALMAEADEYCKREQMLTLQRSEVIRDFSAWYLDEFRRQINGEPPKPWDGPLDP